MIWCSKKESDEDSYDLFTIVPFQNLNCPLCGGSMFLKTWTSGSEAQFFPKGIEKTSYIINRVSIFCSPESELINEVNTSFTNIILFINTRRALLKKPFLRWNSAFLVKRMQLAKLMITWKLREPAVECKIDISEHRSVRTQVERKANVSMWKLIPVKELEESSSILFSL